MTIQKIIRTAMMTGLLTKAQDHQINTLLFQEETTSSDIFLLRRLQRSLGDGSVVQINRLDAVAVGRFGQELRLLPGGASERALREVHEPASASVS